MRHRHKHRLFFAAAAAVALLSGGAAATEGVDQVGGLYENPVRVHAFQGARIFVDDGSALLPLTSILANMGKLTP